MRKESGLEGGSYFLLLVKGDAIKEWEGEGAAGDGFSETQVGGAGAWVLSPGGLQMDGGEVAAGGDSALGEGGLDTVSICGLGETDDVDEPAYGAIGQGKGRKFEAGDVAKQMVVAFCGGLAEGQDFVDARELDAAEGAGYFGKAVVIAGFGVVEPLGAKGSALIAEAAEAGGVGGIMGEYCAAFAGGDLFVWIEAEDGKVAEAANAAGIGRRSEFSTDGLAGVLDEEEVMAGGEGLEGGYVSGNAEGVDEENGAGAGGEGAFDGIGGEVEGEGIDFSEDGCGADLQHRVGDGDEGE